MVKAKELSQKFREEIVALHKKGDGYKKISKLLNVSNDTVGSIIRKFKATGTVATQHGRGQKQKLSAAIEKFLRRQVDRNQAYCQGPEGRLSGRRNQCFSGHSTLHTPC
jgi:transposase